MINRLILWVSLAGMILAIHLWIQKARGFDQGCLGLETHGAMVDDSGGCEEVSALPASHLLGVSNAAWGYAFYFGLALLSFGKIVTPGRWPRRLHLLGEIGVASAFVYSGYLMYEMGAADAWCPLCVISATLVTILAVLHALLRGRGGFVAVEEPARGRELGLAAGALFGAMGMLVGVLVFVDRLGTRALDEGNGALEMRRIVGSMLPAFIDREKLFDMRACHFDGMASRLDPKAFITPDTPFLGKPDGVPVIVFLDPHCPHCRDFFPSYLQLAKEYGDRARFYVLPHELWKFSAAPVAALKLAESSGKYFDLWQREFDAAKSGRLTPARLADIYRELGLDAADLPRRLEAMAPALKSARSRNTASGVQGVPAIFVNGWKVFPLNYSAECLGKLIEASVGPAKTDRRGQARD